MRATSWSSSTPTRCTCPARSGSGKLYRDHSLFPGGLRTQTAEQLVKRHPTDLVKRAVWGMLPKGPLGRRIYKKLKVYAGAEHPHAAQATQARQIPQARGT